MIHNDTNLQDGYGYCRECDSYDREVRALKAKLEVAEKKIAERDAEIERLREALRPDQ